MALPSSFAIKSRQLFHCFARVSPNWTTILFWKGELFLFKWYAPCFFFGNDVGLAPHTPSPPLVNVNEIYFPCEAKSKTPPLKNTPVFLSCYVQPYITLQHLCNGQHLISFSVFRGFSPGLRHHREFCIAKKVIQHPELCKSIMGVYFDGKGRYKAEGGQIYFFSMFYLTSPSSIFKIQCKIAKLWTPECKMMFEFCFDYTRYFLIFNIFFSVFTRFQIWLPSPLGMTILNGPKHPVHNFDVLEAGNPPPDEDSTPVEVPSVEGINPSRYLPPPMCGFLFLFPNCKRRGWVWPPTFLHRPAVRPCQVPSHISHAQDNYPLSKSARWCPPSCYFCSYPNREIYWCSPVFLWVFMPVWHVHMISPGSRDFKQKRRAFVWTPPCGPAPHHKQSALWACLFL